MKEWGIFSENNNDDKERKKISVKFKQGLKDFSKKIYEINFVCCVK